ncbi:tautomerase [Microbacterium mangrovi]|uniref:Tautomerase n=1 Tax=Microbacterium mangrovi TaxID=1348253 RepID=A0A0B2A865_9MICO|nr:tautomerase family protein [Microbacterium mangrovi]KHK97796.1 tautomerase [Microbacterium mangrovi]
MPLVRIDHSESRPNPTEIAGAIHDAIVAVYGIPESDRFQVITARPASTIIAEDAGLGFERTDPLIIQIFTQRGRTTVTKQQLYAEIARRLETVGVAGEDVFIGYVENGPQDWSFGFGRAQHVTGELAVPATSTTA